MMIPPPVQLPDDIKQKLLGGERLHATHDLMEQRGITPEGACMLVGRWLFEREQQELGRMRASGRAFTVRDSVRWSFTAVVKTVLVQILFRHVFDPAIDAMFATITLVTRHGISSPDGSYQTIDP